jgi:hypothetical protein
MNRRKATDAYINAWFSADPVAFAYPGEFPVYEKPTAVAARARVA